MLPRPPHSALPLRTLRRANNETKFLGSGERRSPGVLFNFERILASGYTITVDGSGSCDCDDEYTDEGGFCAGLPGAPCNDAQTCRSGAVCNTGFCAEPCNAFLCVGGTTCDHTQEPPICVCPDGTRLVDKQCANVCSGVSCSGKGLCVALLHDATCACDNGFVPQGEDCVLPGCTPTGTRTTDCKDGDLYWYDSCGSSQEKASECGIRGCASGACVPPHWENRDLSLSAFDSFSGMGMDLISGSGLIAGIAGKLNDSAKKPVLRFAKWAGGGWQSFSADIEVDGYDLYLRTSPADVPTIAFYSANRARVRTFTGGLWGELQNSASTGFDMFSLRDLAVDSNGNPAIVGTRRPTPYETVIATTIWNGSAWSPINLDVQLGKAASLGATSPSITFSGSDALVAWRSGTESKVTVSRWTSNAWSEFDATLPNSPNGATSIDSSHGNTLLVVPDTTTYSLNSYAWNGGQPRSDAVLAPGNSSQSAGAPSVSAAPDDSGRAVAAWWQFNAGIYAKVRNNGAWAELAGSTTGVGIPGGAPNSPIARIRGNQVCVAWLVVAAKYLNVRCAVVD